jgi:hypothetical protein
LKAFQSVLESAPIVDALERPRFRTDGAERDSPFGGLPIFKGVGGVSAKTKEDAKRDKIRRKDLMDCPPDILLR